MADFKVKSPDWVAAEIFLFNLFDWMLKEVDSRFHPTKEISRVAKP